MTRQWNGKGDALDFVVSKNLHRRHLNESQRGMVAVKVAKQFNVTRRTVLAAELMRRAS